MAHVDRPETSTVAGSHVLVEGLDGIGTRELTELLVHVVGARTRVVAQPDTKVLDLQGLLLVDLRGDHAANVEVTHSAMVSSHSACHLNGCKGQQRGYNTDNVDTNDFTTGFLDLVQLTTRSRQREAVFSYNIWYTPQEVPETRLGNDLVGRKYTHAVDLGGGLMFGRKMAADDLVFLERHL